MHSVSWNTHCRDSRDSVPIGNGHVGANVWLASDGRIGVYLGTNDSWSENGRLLKIARLWIDGGKRVDLADRAVRVRMTIDPADASVTVACDGAGGFQARLWVDANRDTLWVKVESAHPARLMIEPWRTSQRQVTSREESHSFVGQRTEPGPLIVEPDELLRIPPGVAAIHQNRRSVVPETLAQQGLSEFASLAADPINQRISGVLAYCVHSDAASSSDTALKLDTAGGTAAVTGGRSTLFACEVLSAQGSRENWISKAQSLASESTNGPDLPRHAQWWQGFHGRSRLEITAGPHAKEVSQAYALHRYMIGCAGRGPHPVKFNGALFTTDAQLDGQWFDADYRRWGGGYWFQNTRLIYWPLLATGDWEMIEPLAAMYLGALPLAEARTRSYYGHAGAFFPETMTFWGSYLFENYGVERDGLPVSEITNEYIKMYWCGALELVQLLLDWASYWQADRDRILSTYVEPLAKATLAFYAEHYPTRDTAGLLSLEPIHVLETWWNAGNPTPDVAGLSTVTAAIARLNDSVSAELSQLAAGLAAVIPPLPLGRDEQSGTSYVLPAERYANRNNMENCALYSVFPFPVFGVGREHLETGRMTWQHRPYQMSHGWSQDAIQSALLGLASEAQQIVTAHALQRNPDYRFPAFWGPNFDWVPDMDHGGAMMAGLQRMALHSHPGVVHVTPAWPADWAGSFLLHARDGIMVEADIENGELCYLTVRPVASGDSTTPLPRVEVHPPQARE